MYAIVIKAYPLKDTWSDEKLVMDLIMSINIRFFLFATSFYYRVPHALNWDIILCSLRK